MTINTRSTVDRNTVQLVLLTLVVGNHLFQCINGLQQPPFHNSTSQSVELVVLTAQDFVNVVRALKEVDTVISIPSGVVLNLSEPIELKPLTPEITAGSLRIRGGVNGTYPSALPLLHLGHKAGFTVREWPAAACTLRMAVHAWVRTESLCEHMHALLHMLLHRLLCGTAQSACPYTCPRTCCTACLQTVLGAAVPLVLEVSHLHHQFITHEDGLISFVI